MAFWSIGPVRGEFQPEEFTEVQGANWESDELSFGSASVVEFKGWERRKLTFTFVVDGLNRNDFPADGDPEAKANNTGAISLGVDYADPEQVFAALVELARPAKGGEPTPIAINLPGWGGAGSGNRDASTKKFGGVALKGSNTPAQAVILRVSINRTHIKGAVPKAMRAMISVELEEATGFDFTFRQQ